MSLEHAPRGERVVRGSNNAVDVVRIRVLPDGRVDRRNAAKYVGVSPKTLANWALMNKGPRSSLVGGRRFYYLSDLEAFVTNGHGAV